MILFVLTIFNCKQDDIQDVDFNSIQNQKETINHFTIEDLPDIEHALNKIGSNTTGRLMTTTFGDLDLSDILQFVNVDGKESYSFRILNSNNSQSQTDFENLHLIKLPEDDGYLAYIIQWQPDPDWYIDNSYIFNIETFSGVMNRFDLDYNLLDSKEFIDGIDVDEQDDNNRTMDNGCDVLQYTVCVDTDDCSCTPDDCYEVIEITCSSGGGGDGGNTGDGNLPNEEGGTGSHVPGGSTPGGTNTGEFVPGGNGGVVTIPPKKSEILTNFGLTLTLQETVWVNKETNKADVEEIIGFLLENCQSVVVTEFTCDEAKEFAQYAIAVSILNPEANPFLRADCRSFEYAQPPGALQKGCAVTNFNHTFYALGINSQGNPYYGDIESNVSIIYFTMPTWMTNGQAANLTAKAVTFAANATDVYFFTNPYDSEYEVIDFFRNTLYARLAIYGGSFSTTNEPFPIPSPAPYITSVVGISNAYDCD
ncbi:hypothetical protein [Xanthomarina gelatinilytica]|uniref:hypothetical protein n=1 Tax=Xanthomarina gelatinilytica TaxID=1137281 RepID=UPI003AA87EC5